MTWAIDLDNPDIRPPLAEAAKLALERKSDLDLDSFILGYKLAFELMANAARAERDQRRRPDKT